jgi:hypothetical protein
MASRRKSTLKFQFPSSRFVAKVRGLLLPAVLLSAALAATPAWAAQGDCGQPQSTGTKPTASDCAYILRVSVKLVACELCVCDVNNSTSVTSTDALQCLRRAVNLPVILRCPSCGPTTTLGPDVSTTSTSTTSTTTTLPVNCGSNSDCSALPQGFRCNPNTDTCEKPCIRNTDCKDFYECNKTTGYCQEPDLLF